VRIRTTQPDLRHFVWFSLMRRLVAIHTIPIDRVMTCDT
jgi:hypothetical protein